jgi:hypothetical protein
VAAQKMIRNGRHRDLPRSRHAPHAAEGDDWQEGRPAPFVIEIYDSQFWDRETDMRLLPGSGSAGSAEAASFQVECQRG